MRLRLYQPEDFGVIRSWTGDERTHALWCANRFLFPLRQADFERVLASSAADTGETPLVMCDDGGMPMGFFCCSTDERTRISKLRFVILSPVLRGKGLGRMLCRMALGYAFGVTDAKAVQLSVFPENTRAVRCYESVGFRELMRTDGVFPFGDETWGRCIMVIENEDR